MIFAMLIAVAALVWHIVPIIVEAIKLEQEAKRYEKD